MINKLKLLGTASVIVPLIVFAIPSAQAQTPPTDNAEGDIIVTGTRIQRDTIDTPTPIIRLGPDELDDVGAKDISETLAELPFVSLSNAATSEGGNAQSEGLATINLRALGDNRALVLIDGRRAVSNSAQANRVSLGSIPDDFIDRIEVITGGASSVYGSDAIAGVVNIITETNQTGFKVKTQLGISDEGDDERLEGTVSWGTRFAKDRGYFLVSGTYEERLGITALDRPFSLIEADYDYNTNLGINEFNGIPAEGGVGGDLPANTFPPNLYRDRSTNFFPGGIFDADISGDDPIGYYPSADEFVFFGRDVTAGDVADEYGETDRVFNNILNPRKRYLGASKFNYDLAGTTEVFGQVQFSREETLSVGRPQDFDDAEDFVFMDRETGMLQYDNGVGDIDEDDPLVILFGPDQLKDPVTGEGLGDIDWDRRFDEVGRTETQNERTTVRSWLGIRGDAKNDWQWEASAGYGRFEQDQVRRNQLNLFALEQGIKTEFVDPGNSNEIRCENEEARAQGCVPVNLFGVGSISEEAAAYIRADLHLNAVIEQQTLQGFMTGTLFEGPAGPIGAAFGIDYRKDQLTLRNDELSRFGGTTAITVPDTDGSIEVFEGFGEVNIPLLRDKPIFQQFDLDLSARVAEYDIDTVGTVFTYRAGVNWLLYQDLRIRGQYARAERAPDLTELYSPARGDTDSGIIDPCDGVTEDTVGNIGVNCLAEVSIAEVVADDGEFESDVSALFSTNEGNIDLESETSDSFTLGTVYSPSFAPGLSISADYYNITVDNVIELFDNNLLLRGCYDSDLSIDANPLCDRVARDLDNGELTVIRQFETNSDRLETGGLDFAVRYNFEMDGGSRVTLRGNATHTLKHEVTRLGETTDIRGSLADSDAYKWRGVGSLTWQKNGVRLRYQAEYFSSILDSRARVLEFQDVQARIPDAEVPLFLYYPEYWNHSISGRYDLDIGGTEIRLTAGINNLFDDLGPFTPDGAVEAGRRGNFNRNYDVRGRRFFFGLEARF